VISKKNRIGVSKKIVRRQKKIMWISFPMNAEVQTQKETGFARLIASI
jgi:hypothetical protein